MQLPVGGSGLRRWVPSRHRSGPWGGPGETRPTALKRYESPGQPSTAASLYTLMGAARYPRWGPAGTPPVKDTETERKRAAALHSLAVHRLARHDPRLTTARLRGVARAATARAASRPRGTLGAHQRKICQEALRTCEISAAGQTVCRVPPPRSRASRHKTRPTGRLTPTRVTCERAQLSGWRGHFRSTRAPRRMSMAEPPLSLPKCEREAANQAASADRKDREPYHRITRWPPLRQGCGQSISAVQAGT